METYDEICRYCGELKMPPEYMGSCNKHHHSFVVAKAYKDSGKIKSIKGLKKKDDYYIR